jgi:hypothetical protein
MTVLRQLSNVTDHESDDDGVIRTEDSFRRAAFVFAGAAKRLAESSAKLGPTTKVAHPALVDIQHARDLLDSLFLPGASKVPADADRPNNLTAEAVKGSVSDLATRIQSHVDDIVGAPPIVRFRFDGGAEDNKPQVHRGVDLNAPVHPKNGKMLWAGVDCPVCPSKATQRCRKDDGTFIEKPHPPRKDTAEASSTSGGEEKTSA